MPVSKDEFEDHALWTALDDLQQQVATASALNADEPSVVADIAAMTAVMTGYKQVEHWRFPSSGKILSGMHAPLVALRDAVAVYEDAPSPNALQNVHQQFDAVSAAMVHFPVRIVLPGHLKGIGEAFATLESANRAAVSSIEQRDAEYRSQVDTRVADLEKQVEASEQRLAVALDELARIQKTASATEQAVQEVQATQSTEFTKALTGAKDRFDEVLSDVRDAAQNNQTEVDAQAKDHIHALEKHEQQARNLLGATSRATISKDYAEYATRQGWAAALWSLAAVATTIGALWFVWTETEHSVEPTDTWQLLGVRSLLTALVVAVSGYMASIANKHRENARAAKQAHLDFQALEPYLTHLSDDAAAQLRQDFAEHHFLRARDSGRSRGALSRAKDVLKSDGDSGR